MLVVRHAQGWPGPFMYTVYDRILGVDFPAKDIVYTP
jgi:hypothetical protein